MLLIKSRRAVNCLAVVVAFVMTLCTFAMFGTTKSYAATSYTLWVGGTRVTSDNANSNSKWSYNASTRTLTLKSYTYSGKGYAGKIYSADDEDYLYFNAPIYWSGNQDLTINVTGTNNVKATYITDDEYEPVGIFAKGNVKFTGSGTLTATGGAKTECESVGVYSLTGDVTLNSGTLNAVGGNDSDSYGIYASKRVFVNGGTLNATGGTLYVPEAESVSSGIYAEFLVIKSGTVNATGGTAGAGTSAGFFSSLRMSGGTLNAKAGSAGVISAGAYMDMSDSQYVVGGTATFTGGSCSKGSYGLYNLPDEPDPTVEGETEPSTHTVHYTGKVTAKGNTAASNQMFDYDYDDDMLLDYLDDSEAGEDGSEGGEDTEEETVEKVGSYYIYSKRYAPIINAGTNVSGTGTTRYVAPDPALDIYTNKKYVNITPAKLPTSIQLSEHMYNQVSAGATMQPTVTYTPSDADIKAVNWSSTNESVATVSSTGLIKVVGTETGVADIYAKIGNCSDVCRVSYVKPSEPKPTIKITYDGSEPVIRTKEGTLQLHMSVSPASYASEAEWAFPFDHDVATFDTNTGIVTGHSNGTVTVVARLSGHTDVYDMLEINIDIPAEEECKHDGDVVSLTVPAGFGTDGYIRRTCSKCHETLSEEVIPAVDSLDIEATQFEYDGQAKEPKVTVTDRLGKVLTRDRDYRLTYDNNVSPGVGHAKVVFINNYDGNYTWCFDINCGHRGEFENKLYPANMEHDGKFVEECCICGTEVATNVIPRIGTLELAQSTYEYTGKAIKPEVIVKNRYGSALTEGEYYDVTYQNNVEIGHATATVAFKGHYESTYTLGFEIVQPAFEESMLRLDKKSIRYSKNPVLPEVVVDGGYDIADFKVEYVNPANKNVGLHSVIVTSDKYGVNKRLTYVIRPIGTKLRTPVAGRKAITVKWNKQATKMAKYRITGYQIQYGVRKDFKNAKKVKVKGYKAISKKLSKLKGGKKYYVRVRTYRTIKGKTYYSLWSAKKAVTTKK